MKRHFLLLGLLWGLFLPTPLTANQNDTCFEIHASTDTIPYSVVIEVFKRACDPISKELGRCVLPEDLIRAYYSGNATLTYIGKPAPGKDSFYYEYSNVGGIITMDDAL